jgi:anti-sigma factor RsiW
MKRLLAGKHPMEEMLALYASGDIELIERLRIALHIHGCGACREHVANHKSIRADLVRLRKGPVPFRREGDLNWDRLSEEMTANIRLGISMAECVGPARGEGRHLAFGNAWRPVAITLGAGVLLAGAFLLNMPLDRIAKIWGVKDQSGMVLEATSTGIEMRRDGLPVISVRHPDRKAGHEVAVNLDGSMSARDVDDDTGQVTIINVAGQ